MSRELQPCFSHGGGNAAWPAVSGATTGAGNPIEVFRADGLEWPIIQHIATGNCTVLTQVNPGPIDEATGVPDAGNWTTIGTDVYTVGGTNAWQIPPGYPYARTNISVYASGTVKSFVPSIRLPRGQKVQAQYPRIVKGGPV